MGLAGRPAAACLAGLEKRPCRRFDAHPVFLSLLIRAGCRAAGGRAIGQLQYSGRRGAVFRYGKCSIAR
jgi:hypothetical protein